MSDSFDGGDPHLARHNVERLQEVADRIDQSIDASERVRVVAQTLLTATQDLSYSGYPASLYEGLELLATQDPLDADGHVGVKLAAILDDLAEQVRRIQGVLYLPSSAPFWNGDLPVLFVHVSRGIRAHAERAAAHVSEVPASNLSYIRLYCRAAIEDAACRLIGHVISGDLPSADSGSPRPPALKPVEFVDELSDHMRLQIALGAAEEMQMSLRQFANDHAPDPQVEANARRHADAIGAVVGIEPVPPRLYWEAVRAAGEFLAEWDPLPDEEKQALAEQIVRPAPPEDNGESLTEPLQESLDLGLRRDVTEAARDGLPEGVRRGVATLVAGTIIGTTAAAVEGIAYLATKSSWLGPLLRAAWSVVRSAGT